MNLKDYIRGQRQGKEANKLERKAMDDPFLQDAIDGYDSVDGDHISAIENLEKRLSSPHKRIDKRWWIWVAAAAIVLLIGIPLLLKLPAEKDLMVASSEIIPKQPEITIPPQQKETAEETTKSTEQNTKSMERQEEHTKPKNEPVILSEAQASEITENLEITKAREVRFATVHDTLGIADIKRKDQLLVSGRIVDETGEPLPGASIIIPNTQIGAITDISGNFHLTVPKVEEGSLIATFIGMNDVNIPLKENVGDIVMKANDMALNEVVVVAFGSQKKETVVGSISTIKDTTKSKSSSSTADRTSGAVSTEDRATFAEEEFKKYFSENYDKEICTGQEIAFVVEFLIDPAGRPGNILIKENSCPAFETEIKRLLLGSPLWSDVNRKVNMRIELPTS